jgi:hypothetical protein
MHLDLRLCVPCYDKSYESHAGGKPRERESIVTAAKRDDRWTRSWHDPVGSHGQPVSKQRRWQIRKQRQGLCRQCGSEPHVKRGMCAACLEKELDRRKVA